MSVISKIMAVKLKPIKSIGGSEAVSILCEDGGVYVGMYGPFSANELIDAIREVELFRIKTEEENE